MFPAETLIILIALDDFGNIIDVVPWGIGVVLEGMQFFVLWYLCDKLLQVHFLIDLLVASPFLLSLLFPSASGLQQLLLLLSLFLNVALHLCDL